MRSAKYSSFKYHWNSVLCKVACFSFIFLFSVLTQFFSTTIEIKAEIEKAIRVHFSLFSGHADRPSFDCKERL